MNVNIQEYLGKHLPYSIKIMLVHKRLSANEYYGDGEVLNAAFVGSIVKGRMLLEVLGIKENSNCTEVVEKTNYRDDDIYYKHFGVSRVNPKTLSREEQYSLLHFLIAVNKYEVHLTEFSQEEIKRDLDQIKPAYEIILKLVRDNIFIPNKTSFPWL